VSTPDFNLIESAADAGASDIAKTTATVTLEALAIASRKQRC
jgi:hypothetical protein